MMRKDNCLKTLLFVVFFAAVVVGSGRSNLYNRSDEEEKDLINKWRQKESYNRHYPKHVEGVGRYSKERIKSQSKLSRSEHYIKGIHDILLVFLIIFLVIVIATCLMSI